MSIRFWQASIMVIMTLAAAGCHYFRRAEDRTPANTVISYLHEAQRQTETTQDRLQLKQALEDILNLPPPQLKSRRYADYQGHPGAWSVTRLISQYFIPARPVALDSVAFYDQYRDPEAQALIRVHLETLNADLREEPR